MLLQGKVDQKKSVPPLSQLVLHNFTALCACCPQMYTWYIRVQEYEYLVVKFCVSYVYTPRYILDLIYDDQPRRAFGREQESKE